MFTNNTYPFPILLFSVCGNYASTGASTFSVPRIFETAGTQQTNPPMCLDYHIRRVTYHSNRNTVHGSICSCRVTRRTSSAGRKTSPGPSIRTLCSPIFRWPAWLSETQESYECIVRVISVLSAKLIRITKVRFPKKKLHQVP